MADNPRSTEHFSDTPSSRPSAGLSNPPGSSGENYNPPPRHGGSSSGKINYRNIIIGAIVTIITSTLVFLITQSLKKPEGGDSTRQLTTTAWNSYVGYENIYTSNVMSLSKNPSGNSPDSILKDFKNESLKFQRDISDLAEDKKIDKDLRKVLTRRLENERAALPVLEAYYSNMKKINAAEMTMKERVSAIIDEMGRYNDHSKGMYERAINDIKGIADILSKRYDQEFSMEDFLIVKVNPQLMKSNDSLVNALRNLQFDSNGNVLAKPVIIVTEKDIIGSWNADGAVFTFQKDGKMAWVIGAGQKATGTWKIVNNQLRLDGSINNSTQKGFWLFDVAEVSENSLFLVSTKDLSVTYSLVRIITQ